MVYVEKKKQFKFQLSVKRSNANTIESNVIHIFNVYLPIYTYKEFLHNDTYFCCIVCLSAHFHMHSTLTL